MRIFSANWGTGAGRGYPFNSLGEVISVYDSKEFEKHSPAKGDVLIIWGGADIHPSLYNRPNVASHVGIKPSVRDIVEVGLMEKAVDIGIMTLGVCRGAQLACALAGGVLAQDVDAHGWNHDITLTATGEKIETSSVHHQMMVPVAVPHELIAISTAKMSAHYAGLNEAEQAYVDKFGEPEIVYFPKQKFLAVQGHPEFMDEDCKFNVLMREYVNNYRTM